jgi:hypothetical protein
MYLAVAPQQGPCGCYPRPGGRITPPLTLTPEQVEQIKRDIEAIKRGAEELDRYVLSKINSIPFFLRIRRLTGAEPAPVPNIEPPTITLPPPPIIDPNIYSKGKDNKKIVWGLIGAAEGELAKLRNDPPEGGARNHHKGEIKAMLDRAKNIADRLVGKAKDTAKKAIEAIEKEAAKH